MTQVKAYIATYSKEWNDNGGYAFRIFLADKKWDVVSIYRRTSDNRMLLLGLSSILRSLNKNDELLLYTYSKYLHGAYTNRWLNKWARAGFKYYTGARKGKPVQNRDLWQKLYSTADLYKIKVQTFVPTYNPILENLKDLAIKELIDKKDWDFRRDHFFEGRFSPWEKSKNK